MTQNPWHLMWAMSAFTGKSKNLKKRLYLFDRSYNTKYNHQFSSFTVGSFAHDNVPGLLLLLLQLGSFSQRGFFPKTHRFASVSFWRDHSDICVGTCGKRTLHQLHDRESGSIFTWELPGIPVVPRCSVLLQLFHKCLVNYYWYESRQIAHHKL